jgi:hypothetical protein
MTHTVTHRFLESHAPKTRELMWRAFLLFAATRALVFAGAYLWLCCDPQQAALDPGSALWHGDPGGRAAAAQPWLRWDALWFLHTARDGYVYTPGAQCNLSIFPLYPMLISLLARTGLDPVWAGVLISNACLFGAVCLLLRVAWPRVGGAAAQRAAAALLLFPPAFVLSGVYSESLFLFAVLGAFYFADRREWAEAGLCGFAAALTRVTGAALALPLAVMFFANRPRGESAARALWLLLPPLAAVLFLAYVHGGTGSWTTYFDAQAHWDKQLSPPWVGLGWELFGGAWRLDRVLNVASFALFAALGVIAWRRLGPGWGLFVALGVIVPACSSRWIGMPRYMLVLFPAFVALGAMLKNRWAFAAWAAGSAALLLVSFRAFLNWNISF